MNGPGRTGNLGVQLWAVAVVAAQSALLLLAMMLAFGPIAWAAARLGAPQGYALNLLYPVALYLLLAAAHRWLTGLRPSAGGFSLRSLPVHLCLGLVLGAAAVLGILGLTALWRPSLGLALSSQAAAPGALAVLLADVVETGFAEEFLVRGFMLPALIRRGIQPQTAALISVLLFALAHFQVQPIWWLLPIAATGLFLSYLYYATASIWAPVGCHLAINLVFGLVNRGILLQAPGPGDHLADIAAVECVVFLTLAALAALWHQRRVAAGASDFPLPRMQVEHT